MGKIEDLLTAHSVMVNEGSGCLFQPNDSDDTYVLTAKHCITDSKKNILTKEDIGVCTKSGTKIEVNGVYCHKAEDAAILTVKKIDGINIDYASCSSGEPVILFGFPQTKRNEKQKFQRIDCNVNFEMEDYVVIESTPPLFTSEFSVSENTVGLSGCGGFKFEKINERLVLVGIIYRLAEPKGVGGQILLQPMRIFKDITLDYKLPLLIPKHFNSFEGYKNEIWQEFEGWGINSTKKLLENEATKVISKKISPKIILDHYQDELCIPNDKNWVYDRDLWSGWLEFLTYNKLVKDEIESDELEFAQKLIGNKKFFYNNKVNNWREVIEEIKKLDLPKSKELDCIVINTKCKIPQPKTKISSELVNLEIGRVTTPCPSDREGSQKRIDNGHTPIKNFPFIHLQEFKKKINENKNLEKLEGNGDDAIIQELQNSIKQAFKNE